MIANDYDLAWLYSKGLSEEYDTCRVGVEHATCLEPGEAHATGPSKSLRCKDVGPYCLGPFRTTFRLYGKDVETF